MDHFFLALHLQEKQSNKLYLSINTDNQPTLTNTSPPRTPRWCLEGLRSGVDIIRKRFYNSVAHTHDSRTLHVETRQIPVKSQCSGAVQGDSGGPSVARQVLSPIPRMPARPGLLLSMPAHTERPRTHAHPTPAHTERVCTHAHPAHAHMLRP